jgi:hypothetical protein
MRRVLMDVKVGDTVRIPDKLCNGVTPSNFIGGWVDVGMGRQLGRVGVVLAISCQGVYLDTGEGAHYVWDKRLFTSPLVDVSPHARVISKIKQLDDRWKCKQLAKSCPF